MRKMLALTGIACLAALASAQMRGSDLLGGFAKTLNSAPGLSTTYTFREVNGAPETIKVDVAKPNLARIETNKELILADGSNIYRYDKNAKTYYKTAQTDKDLTELFADDETRVWAPFFSQEVYAKAPSKALGMKSRKSMQLNVVEVSLSDAGNKTMTLYLDRSNLARQATILNDGGNQGSLTYIVDTQELTLRDKADADLFTWKAPEGSRELSMEELNSGKWFTNYDEALKLAQDSNRILLVDFYAEWCGPCKMLEREVYSTDAFKAMSKNFVFCKIDVDKQPALAKKFNITAMPTVEFLRGDGAVIKKQVGYGGVAQFMQLMNEVKKMAGM